MHSEITNRSSSWGEDATLHGLREVGGAERAGTMHLSSPVLVRSDTTGSFERSREFSCWFALLPETPV